MKKILLLTSLSIIISSVNINLRAQEVSIFGDFPYEESFIGTDYPSGTLPSYLAFPQSGSIITTSNSASLTANGLQLTPNTTGQFGAAYVKNRQFTARNGIIVEFEYSMYSQSSIQADGLSFFLFDASVPDDEVSIGDTGGALGYRYTRSQDQSPEYRVPGLSKAYLGVGLDAWENFRTAGNSYNGGIVYYYSGIDPSILSDFPPYGFPMTTFGRQTISIRGAAGKALAATAEGGLAIPEGYTGYPVLISQPVAGDAATYPTYARGIRIKNDGLYEKINRSYTTPMSLINKSLTPSDPADSNYRKMKILLYPHKLDGSADPDATDGFDITVILYNGARQETIIDKYHYKESTIYKDYAQPVDGFSYNYAGEGRIATLRSPAPTYTLDSKVPEFLRFGFAASTGGYSQANIVRNVQVSLPSASVAQDDLYNNTGPGVPLEISPLNNDWGYAGLISMDQIPSSNYLDKTRFEFLDGNNNKVGSTAGNIYTYVQPSVGTWSYNLATGNVTFTSLSTFSSISTGVPASINYRIRAGINNEAPYTDLAYASLPTKIQVYVGYPYILTNRHIQPLLK